MKKLRKNDEVMVTSGKDKSKRGRIARFFGQDKLIVDGINLVKKHQKPNPAQNIPGSIISKEAPIHISNVSIWNDSEQKTDRVGFRFNAEGKKERYYKSTGKTIENNG